MLVSLRRRASLRIILTILIFVATLLPIRSARAQVEKIGVLVIAHGAREIEWNRLVEAAVEKVGLPYPVALGFLEFAEPDIQAAVAKLEEQGVKKIIAVPLFVSTHSNHIEEIKYILGLRKDLPEEDPAHTGHHGRDNDEEELVPVKAAVHFLLTPALDDHPVVAAILGERLASISQDPSAEIAVLVGHGSDTAAAHQKWQETFASLARQLKSNLGFKDVRYAFVAMGEPGLRDVVARAQGEGTVLVMPVMISEGHYTSKKIPQVLQGLNYRYPEAGSRALLPHEKICSFIELRVNDAVLPPIQVRTRAGTKQVYYTDVALEPDGKICVCGSFAFRAMQVALSRLWSGMPTQDEIKVVASVPTHGTREALEAIVGPGNFIIRGNDEVNVTAENYTYLVTNKKTGATLRITARKEVFPEGFFTLRAKVKSGSATPGEKAAFQKLRSQVVSAVRWTEPDELFTWDIVPITFKPGHSEYTVAGEVWPIDATPFMKGDTIYLPLRYLASALGVPEKGIEWISQTRTARLAGDSTELVVHVNSKTAYLDGQPKVLVDFPVLKNGRVYLPVRHGEALFGRRVNWAKANHIVEIWPLGF